MMASCSSVRAGVAWEPTDAPSVRDEYRTKEGISLAGSKNLQRRQALTVSTTSSCTRAGVYL